MTQKGGKLYGTLVYRIVKNYFEAVSSKVKKMSLIGAPYQIIIGKKTEGDVLEFKEIGNETKNISLVEIIKIIKEQKAINWFPH